MARTYEEVLADVKALSNAEQDHIQRELEKGAGRRREERLAAIARLQGIAAQLPGSVDEFLARKREDIEIENRRFGSE